MAEPILTADHLLEDLFARVDGHIVDGLVPLGADKVQLAVVAECAPLRVDDHVFLAGEVGRVQRADVLVDRGQACLTKYQCCGSGSGAFLTPGSGIREG
jgi:hypothetical protein